MCGNITHVKNNGVEIKLTGRIEEEVKEDLKQRRKGGVGIIPSLWTSSAETLLVFQAGMERRESWLLLVSGGV